MSIINKQTINNEWLNNNESAKIEENEQHIAIRKWQNMQDVGPSWVATC